MKRLIISLLVLMFGLSACAAVYTDASDSDHVTFFNSDGASIASLTQQANAYCAQYGKLATFRKNDTALVAVFDCRFANQAPR